MPAKVLNEDWSEYDNKKKKATDANFFACTESWEVDYLVRVIKKAYPVYSDTAIRGAISACCIQVGGNHPRDKFVACVMQRLRS